MIERKFILRLLFINLKLFDIYYYYFIIIIFFFYKRIHSISMFKSALYLRQDLLTMYVEYIAWVIIHW